MGKQDLEQEWRSMQKILEAKDFLVFPSTIGDEESVVMWSRDQGAEPFLDLAHNLGVRLVYAEARHLNEDDISEIESRLVPDEETTPSQDVKKLLSRCRTFLGRVLAIDVDWVYSGIWHRYARIADWYGELEGEISELEEEIEEQTSEKRQGEKVTQRNDRKKDAERLSKEHDFQVARGGSYARRRVVKRMFPDLGETDIANLEYEAWTIYQNEILPEQERTQAREIRRMLAEGASKHKVATELGIKPEKVSRLLRSYPE